MSTVLESVAFGKPFWRGWGLWRIPHFLRSLRIDAPQFGLVNAAAYNFRRLTMESAARQLPRSAEPAEHEPLPVYFMSGRDHWPMTAFCAFSLLESTKSNVVPMVMDDGTLGGMQRDELKRILPRAVFLNREASEDNVNRWLPEKRFPALRTMRRELPLMRKLLDLHAGQTGWRLFLDSDMLFWSEPAWMLDWLRTPTGPAYMSDFKSCYGYSDALLQTTFGRPMRPLINTGICGLLSESINWEQVEHWAARLLSAEGTNHFSEQCLSAMILATNGGRPAPKDYQIWPTGEETRHATATMHHYVAESRVWYHVYGWPAILRQGLSLTRPATCENKSYGFSH
jgi:hypothetical protein